VVITPVGSGFGPALAPTTTFPGKTGGPADLLCSAPPSTGNLFQLGRCRRAKDGHAGRRSDTHYDEMAVCLDSRHQAEAGKLKEKPANLLRSTHLQLRLCRRAGRCRQRGLNLDRPRRHWPLRRMGTWRAFSNHLLGAWQASESDYAGGMVAIRLRILLVCAVVLQVVSSGAQTVTKIAAGATHSLFLRATGAFGQPVATPTDNWETLP